MSGEKERVDAYLDTVKRMEPDITFVDSAAGWASIAISLKRIADAMVPNRQAQAAIAELEDGGLAPTARKAWGELRQSVGLPAEVEKRP